MGEGIPGECLLCHCTCIKLLVLCKRFITRPPFRSFAIHRTYLYVATRRRAATPHFAVVLLPFPYEEPALTFQCSAAKPWPALST